MARPTSLTKEAQEQFISALTGGSTLRDACAYAGISEDTLARHRKKNADFADAIKKAQAQARVMSVARIRKAGSEGAWQADAWYLERSDPDQWGKRTFIKLEGNITVDLVNQTVKALSEAGYDPAVVFNDLIAEAARERANTDSASSTE